MPVVKNAKAIFNAIPSGYLTDEHTIRYDDTETIDTDNVPLNGGFLVKTLYTSLQLYMRMMMRAPDDNMRIPVFSIGQPLVFYGIGVVLRSENQEVKPGQHIYGYLPHQLYTILPSLTSFLILDAYNPDGKLPWSSFLGSAGFLGQTAYYGWREYSKAKKGETVFVTTGGNPVGAMVIQLAKSQSLRVIASAGSDSKVSYMKSLGADVAFNYKTSSTVEILKKEGPIDIFWDNVGGETLEAALDAANVGARFIECGMASGYGSSPSKPPSNLYNLITKEISMHGFITTSLAKNWEEEFYSVIPSKLIAGLPNESSGLPNGEGGFQGLEEVWEGLDKTAEAMRVHLEGRNRGAVVLKVGEE